MNTFGEELVDDFEHEVEFSAIVVLLRDGDDFVNFFEEGVEVVFANAAKLDDEGDYVEHGVDEFGFSVAFDEYVDEFVDEGKNLFSFELFKDGFIRDNIGINVHSIDEPVKFFRDF